jgi:hypothetical protein
LVQQAEDDGWTCRQKCPELAVLERVNLLGLARATRRDDGLGGLGGGGLGAGHVEKVDVVEVDEEYGGELSDGIAVTVKFGR